MGKWKSSICFSLITTVKVTLSTYPCLSVVQLLQWICFVNPRRLIKLSGHANHTQKKTYTLFLLICYHPIKWNNDFWESAAVCLSWKNIRWTCNSQVFWVDLHFYECVIWKKLVAVLFVVKNYAVWWLLVQKQAQQKKNCPRYIFRW